MPCCSKQTSWLAPRWALRYNYFNWQCIYLKKRVYETPQRHCCTAGVPDIHAGFSKRGLWLLFHWHRTRNRTPPLRNYTGLWFAECFTVTNPRNTHVWGGEEADYQTEGFKPATVWTRPYWSPCFETETEPSAGLTSAGLFWHDSYVWYFLGTDSKLTLFSLCPLNSSEVHFYTLNVNFLKATDFPYMPQSDRIPPFLNT